MTEAVVRVPKVGQPVADDFARLFDRTDRHLASIIGQLPLDRRAVFTHVWQYKRGDVFRAGQSVPVRIGGLPSLWYGVFLAPSIVARCAARDTDASWWGTDMKVQFVRGRPDESAVPEDWEFFHAPEREPEESGSWWRTRKGLELLFEDEFRAFYAAFLKALRNQTERHAREQRATQEAAVTVFEARVARDRDAPPTM